MEVRDSQVPSTKINGQNIIGNWEAKLRRLQQ